jgi:CBS domain-containing protein
LWLVLTGKIQRLEFGEFKIEAAFVEASKASIAEQVTALKLPVESVRMDPKTGVGEIPRLISNRTEALYFQLGYGGYYGPAIEEYLQTLTRYPFLKYIILIDRPGQFVGMADARELYSLLSSRGSSFSAEDFARWINTDQREPLRSLPGYVPAQDAIRKEADKQTVLERMEKLNLETLPVIDDKGKFAGVVNQSRLTASLIIDVAKKVR